MTARGTKAAKARLVNGLMDLERELPSAYYTAECDWGGRHDGSLTTVAFRKQGSSWLSVCEHHATGPNVRRPILR